MTGSTFKDSLKGISSQEEDQGKDGQIDFGNLVKKIEGEKDFVLVLNYDLAGEVADQEVFFLPKNIADKASISIAWAITQSLDSQPRSILLTSKNVYLIPDDETTIDSDNIGDEEILGVFRIDYSLRGVHILGAAQWTAATLAKAGLAASSQGSAGF